VLLIALLAMVVSCDKDSGVSLELAPESEAAVKEGLLFNSEGGEVNLHFSTSEDLEPVVSVVYNDNESYQWIITDSYLEQGHGCVTIRCDRSDDSNTREALVTVVVGDAGFSVKVSQSPVGYVTTSRDEYVFGSAGESAEIELETNGTLTCRFKFSTIKWIKHELVKKEKGYALSLNVDANEGFGRVAFADIYVDGVKCRTISLRQQPAKFSENTVIVTTGAGQLYVLLGDDEDNLGNIRALELVGRINALDLYVLAKRLFKSGAVSQHYPLELDLWNASIVPGDKPYDPELSIDMPEQIPTVDYATLPDYYFDGAANIVSLRIPGNTETIGSYCFRNCRGLDRIEIPEDVITVKNGAFKGCLNLVDIVIGPESRLKSIGNYVFDTGSRINSLYLPYGLSDISHDAFKRCKVVDLYVGWDVPPVLEVMPDVKVLYVPVGTKSAYEASTCWSGIPDIIEYNPEIE